MTEVRKFTLTEDHIRLIRCFYIEQYPGNSPYVDQKRPYGNSDILQDVHEILGTIPALVKSGEAFFSDEQDAYAAKVHDETGQALQIVLRVGSFAPGNYIASKYSQDWRSPSPVEPGDVK